jgi:hypothetical protein
VISCLEEVSVRSYTQFGGTGFHGSPSRIRAQESYPNIFRVVSYCLRLVLLLYE